MSAPGDDGAAARLQAEADAERVMAMYRLQQQAESMHAGRDVAASRWIVVALAALFGALMGALVGSLRGHAAAAALAFAVAAGLLAWVRQRAS